MKYITNFFGVGCAALLAMLIMAPGAFAQVVTPDLPIAPTGVEAEATEDTEASITIKWAQVTGDDVGGLPLLAAEAGYVVEVSEDGATGWATSTEIVVAAPPATATEKASAVHTLTTAPTHNQTRHYRVRAVSGAGQGPPSAVVMATTHTLPNAPTGLTAVATKAAAGVTAAGYITISWPAMEKGPATGGLPLLAAEAGYTLQVTANPNAATPTWEALTVVAPASEGDPFTASHDLSSLTPSHGVTRYYRVRANNDVTDTTPTDVDDHIVGPWSAVVSGTTHDIPDAPTGVTLEVENADNTNTEREIKITWNEVPEANNGGLAITGYTVEQSSDQGATWAALPGDPVVSVSGGKLDTTHTGLTPADPVVTWYYRVSAISAASPATGRNYSTVVGVKLGGPAAPKDLKVVAVDGIEAMDLSWTAPENDGEPQVTAYRIEKAGADDGTGTVTGFTDDGDDSNDDWTELAASYTGRAFRDRGLTSGGVYGYRVSAINVVATGAVTDGVGAISSNKALMPRNLTATLADDMASIELTWDRPVADGDKPANGGSPISGYKIEASKDAGTTWEDVEEDKEEHPESELLTAGASTEYAYEHENLDHGASYIYRVSAITDAGPGAVSASSAAVSTSAVKPGAPGSLTAEAAEDMNTITLEWPAPMSNGGAAITAWKIEVSEDYDVASPDDATWADLALTVTDPADPMADDAMYSAVHSGLNAGATYHYRVSATNSVGTGDPSEIAMATAVDIPNAPKDLTAVADGETTINLSWEAPDDNGGASIASYKIESSPDGTDGSWTDLSITVTNPTDPDADGARYTASHTGLEPGTTRHYRVSAINSADPAKTGAASNVANATTNARGVVTRYAVSDDGGTTGECTDIAAPCTLGAVLAASSADFDDLILVRVRRAGETATIREDITINKMVTLGVYVRGASAAGKGAVSFSGTVKLADGASVMTHKDATVHFDEVEISGSPSIDKLTVRDDLTISEDDPENTMTSVLAVDELTVNSGQTLSLGQGADVRVRLTKGDVGKMNGKLDVKGTIDGTGDLWIAHTSGERSATGFTLHEPGDYAPDMAIAPSKVKFTPDDCLMVTGGGTVENDLHAVAAGNVCVALEEIGNLVAVGSIDGQDDITTDVIFRNAVTVTGNVHQWNDARVVFEKNAMIEGDVSLSRGDGGVGTTYGTANSDPDEFERAMNSGVEFGGLSNTIEGDLDLEFDGSSGGSQALFSVNSGQRAMSTVEGDLIIEDGGEITLEGHPGVLTDRTNNPRVHDLTVEGDVFVYANAEIMLEHAATSSIHSGLCSAPGLRFGNKVMLEGDIVFTEGTSLTIETVVITDNVEVEEDGTLMTTTLHVTADGELDADDNVEVGDAIILQGDGLEGTLAAGSTLNNITYATVDSDEIAMGSAVTRLSVNVGANRELRISEAVTVTNLGLCSGTLVLIDTDTDDNTLTVTEHLTVLNGYMSLDSNRPGTAGTDVTKPNAAAADGYILEYVTAGERMAGAEWFAPRKVAVNHKDAVVIVSEAKSLAEGVHIFKGHLHMKGDGSNLTIGMPIVSGLSPFLMVDNGELHSNGNNVMVSGTVTVVPGAKKTGKIVTGGGELHVLGQNPKGVYTNASAVATVGVGGTIDVGMGALQLGPAYTAAGNGLEGDARPDVTLTLNKSSSGAGMVKGKIFVPAGSKQTYINGESFDTVVLDATANPKKSVIGAGNWGGGLNFHSTKVTIDSLAAMNDGAIEFYDQLGNDDDAFAIVINKDVELNSARLYVNQKNSLTLNGDLTFGKTGGMRVWDKASVTVKGDYTQNKGEQHAGHQDGLGLGGENVFTVMGDFMVADSAHRFESGAEDKIVLKGGFDFGAVLVGSKEMLNADLEFSGKEAQMAGSEVDLGNVVINNSKGLVLTDTMSQGATSMLTLTSGVISSDMHPWVVKNTDIEEDIRGRNNALTTCDSGENCAYVIMGGTRRAHVSTGVTRHVMKGNSGEGEMSGGYLFPVGGMNGDRAHYRPLIMQLEDDLSEAMPVTVTPVMASDDLGEINIVVPIQGGSLTLNAHADMFWKVESKEAPDQNSHIRIAASGLANVFDDSRLRMVQWDCDWTNARLAGMQIVGTDNDSFAENGYVNGVLNLTQRSVETGTCAILGVAANGIENPIHMDPLTGGIARIQFIHNLPLPFPVDLFLDGVKLKSGLDFQSATGYGHYAAGDHNISVVPVVPPGVPAATIEIPLPSLVNEQNYAVIAHGAVTDAKIKILSTRLRSTVDNMVEAILVHGSAELGDVDVRILDPADNMTPTKLLANNFAFNSATRYISLAAGAHNVQVTSPDNRNEVNVYYLDLNGYQGETLVLNLSGGMNDLGFMGVRSNGDVFLSQIVTGVEEEGGPEIPTEFTLHGNYPNPFNPSTRIQFDLPESAQVTLQVVDMLGRKVMTLPAKQFEAGANRTLPLNATSLASGQYLYRIIATGAENQYVKTGRMTLVK